MADTAVKKEEQQPAKPTSTTTAPPPAEVASDPEEDDLSDLDDVLDDFANTKLDSKPPAAPVPPTHDAPSSGPGRPEDVSPAALLLEDEDAFAAQLQKEMEQLLGQGDFGKQFEDIMKEMSAELGGANPLAASSDSTSKAQEKDTSKAKDKDTAAAPATETSFQETIQKTMERMQSSGDAAGAAATSAPSDDILQQLFNSMQDSSGPGNDEDFSKILMGMMEQLTNRDILYEPMKELDDKFPGWMEKNEGKVEGKDMERYREQQVLVREITGRFERKGYSDENAGDREYIVERMQKVCFAEVRRVWDLIANVV